MASAPGFKPGPHWWEASALTTALIKHQNIFPLMIILLALVTFSLGNVLKLLENKWMLVTLGT